MAHIRKKDGSMAVTFENVRPERIENPGFSGTCSQISWDNAAVMRGLRTMFGCESDEQITAIEVDAYGIKAQFKRV